MSKVFLFSNNASSLLLTAVDAHETWLELPTGDGDMFPDPIYGDEEFAVTLKNPDTGETEICYCIHRIYGDTLVVKRGQEGTVAIAFPAGATVAHQLTAGVLSYLRDL